MFFRHAFFVAVVVAAAGFAACTLNPQPLPPDDDNRASAGGDSGQTRSDAGEFGQDPETPLPPPQADAGVNLDSEGGVPSGDAGDAGDSGDAAIGDAAVDG